MRKHQFIKNWIILLVILFAHISYGQNIFFHIGGNISQFYSNVKDDNFSFIANDYNAKIGYSIGINTRLHLSEKINLTIGANFITRGARYDYVELIERLSNNSQDFVFTSDHHETIYLDYIAVPISLSTPILQKLKLETGVTLGYLRHINKTELQIITYKDLTLKEKIDVGTIFGFTNELSQRIELSTLFYLGLVPVESQRVINPPKEYWNKNISISLAFSYLLYSNKLKK